MMQTLRVFRSWGEGGVYFHGLHVNLQIMEKQGENSSKQPILKIITYIRAR